jgi:hypothetical protein
LPDEITRRLGATPSMSTEAGEQKSEQSFGAAMNVATGPGTKLVNAGLSSVSKPKVDSNILRTYP